MITIKTLEGIDVPTLTNTFNQAFSDYLVPLQLTEEQLKSKLIADDTFLQYSVGAFSHNQLIGFILHGFRQEDGTRRIYNGGTGVIPEYRGNRLTVSMYKHILPVLKAHHIQEIVLEVLENNTKALRSYETAGFKANRMVKCYSGKVSINTINQDIQIKAIENPDWQKLTRFWDFLPTWQNTVQSVQNLRDTVVVIGAYLSDELVGYVAFNPMSKRIQQLAVNPSSRNKGIGATLIHYLISNYSHEISIMNVEDNHPQTHNFLARLGLQNTVNQIEMVLRIEG